MGACGHYTVIGYPDYIVAGFGTWFSTTQWGPGCRNPIPPRRHISVVAALILKFYSHPFFSPGKFFLCFNCLQGQISFFTFGFSFKELLLLKTLAEAIFAKKEAKREKEIKARWAQDKSFSKIKVDVFPQIPLSLFCLVFFQMFECCCNFSVQNYTFENWLHLQFHFTTDEICFQIITTAAVSFAVCRYERSHWLQPTRWDVKDHLSHHRGKSLQSFTVRATLTLSKVVFQRVQLFSLKDTRATAATCSPAQTSC